MLIEVVGPLTYVSVPQLDAVIATLDPAIRSVVIDCAALTGIDSPGCGQLVVIRRALGPAGRLLLRNVRNGVRDTLDRLELSREIVEIE